MTRKLIGYTYTDSSGTAHDHMEQFIFGNGAPVKTSEAGQIIRWMLKQEQLYPSIKDLDNALEQDGHNSLYTPVGYDIAMVKSMIRDYNQEKNNG